VKVVDPCFNTKIVTSDISTMMSASILGYDELDLATELQSKWTWIDTVDNSISPSVCTNCCGPIVYEVTDTLFAAQDLVFLSGDHSKLVLQPLLKHDQGQAYIKQLYLVARMQNYPSVSVAYDAFSVQVLQCRPSIDASAVQASLSTKQIVWGQSAKQFNLSTALSKYVQTPPCQYAYTFTAKLGVWNAGLGVYELYGLPSWFVWNQASGTIEVEKCAVGSPRSSSDSDCLGTPTPGVYKVFISAALPGTAGP